MVASWIPSCRTLILNLTESEEGDVTWLERAGVKLHLSFCGECYRFVTQATVVRAALAGLPVPAVSARTKALLMDRFRVWRASRGGEAVAGPDGGGSGTVGDATGDGTRDPPSRPGRKERP